MQTSNFKHFVYLILIVLIKNLTNIYCYSETWNDSLNDIILDSGKSFSDYAYQFQHYDGHLSKNALEKHLLKRPDFNFNLALKYLAMYGRPDVITYLIDDLGAEVNLVIDGDTSINHCCARIENLKILIERGADLNHLNRRSTQKGNV